MSSNKMKIPCITALDRELQRLKQGKISLRQFQINTRAVLPRVNQKRNLRQQFNLPKTTTKKGKTLYQKYLMQIRRQEKKMKGSNKK